VHPSDDHRDRDHVRAAGHAKHADEQRSREHPVG